VILLTDRMRCRLLFLTLKQDIPKAVFSALSHYFNAVFEFRRKLSALERNPESVLSSILPSLDDGLDYEHVCYDAGSILAPTKAGNVDFPAPCSLPILFTSA